MEWEIMRAPARRQRPGDPAMARVRRGRGPSPHARVSRVRDARRASRDPGAGGRRLPWSR